MLSNKNILVGIATILGLIFIVVTGCTTPIYQKSVTYSYDAKGTLIGISETELISQPATSSSGMKVKITHRDKLEEK